MQRSKAKYFNNIVEWSIANCTGNTIKIIFGMQISHQIRPDKVFHHKTISNYGSKCLHFRMLLLRDIRRKPKTYRVLTAVS